MNESENSAHCVMHPRTKDHGGKTYNRLTVLGFSHYRTRPNGKREAYWLCQCVCGGDPKPIAGHNLTSGAVRSCGCLVDDAFFRAGAEATLRRLAEKRAMR